MYYKNINIEQVNQKNSDWLIEYKKLNTSDTITERYISIKYVDDIPHLLVDNVTEKWDLHYDGIVDLNQDDVILGGTDLSEVE